MPVLQRVSVSVKNILLSTDFTPASERAAEYAKGLAQNFHSKVEIAHVFDPSLVTTYTEATVAASGDQRREIRRREMVRIQREFLGAHIEACTALLEGEPLHEVLLKEIRDREIDLVVAGTHSKWGLEKLLLGSMAEQIIRKSPAPVLTVGPHARRPPNGPLVFRNIIYATDFSPEAAKAAAFALSFAQDSGAHLYFCHVVETDPLPEHRTTVDMPFKLALEKMIPESAFEWCSPEAVVRHGEASQVILDLAVRVHADLIVLGARHASFWLTRIENGMTPNLLAEATCPVMTIS